ncbi:M23 family metallopeptidase [Bifidobacterium olomucense]|uniref:Peptidase M23 n=1 Tax=Bifidobacterium olomucense TaxID=2675324 RepID=A0A7Y0EX67_9BIFI|nr:M23 family metallopeptidase [Bifidobacterium sp. DSM 109959]NMM98024.1 peptidase M23 [Bifidobacterium sp. DSM 109959]
MSWFDWRRDEAQRVAKWRDYIRRQAEQQHKRRMDAVISAVTAMGLLLALGLGWIVDSHYEGSDGMLVSGTADYSIADFTGAVALEHQIAGSCEAAYIWPVIPPQMVRKFERPLNPWSAGHRGIDLAAGSGASIVAPKAGVVSFVGSVAGKTVLSIRHRGGVTSTFEPAETELSVGQSVTRGQAIGVVAGNSDHCDDQCLHWGLKRGADDYLDPESYASRRRIVVKPLFGFPSF